MSVLAKLKTQNDEFSTWRRHIHQHPETAFEEVQTSDYVANLLTSWGVEIHRGMAKTAVVGIIKGKNGTAKRGLGLRADLDALNIREETMPATTRNSPEVTSIPSNSPSSPENTQKSAPLSTSASVAMA